MNKFLDYQMIIAFKSHKNHNREQILTNIIITTVIKMKVTIIN